MTKTYPAVEGSGHLYSLITGLIVEPMAGGSAIYYCAGSATLERELPFKSRLFVDLDEDMLSKIPPEYGEQLVQDVKTYSFRTHDTAYDAALCMDGIEHLQRREGLQLLDLMKRVAARVLIFTPLGALDVKPYEGTDYQRRHDHHSGWIPADFPDWNTLVFPRWHGDWAGAFFAWRGAGADDNDFRRVVAGIGDLDAQS